MRLVRKMPATVPPDASATAVSGDVGSTGRKSYAVS